MHILWITPQTPCSIGGGQSRQLSLLRYIAQFHEVTVITLVSPEEQGHEAEASQYCKRLTAIPYTRPGILPRWQNRLASWKQLLLDPQPHYARTYPIEHLLSAIQSAQSHEHYDLVHLEHLFVAPLRATLGTTPSLLACQNIEHQVARQQFELARRPSRRASALLEWAKLRRFECGWLRRFDALTAISPIDAASLRKIAPRVPVHLVPHGVDTASFAPPHNTSQVRSGLVFIGTMGYRPNVDGVLYFCREIWPLILKATPNHPTLTIVGTNPTPEVQELANYPGIKVTGYVPNVRPYLWQAALSVVPLRAGGGVRIKILESLAAGCPVVSTTVGATGIELNQTDGLLRADSPEKFAKEVAALLQNPTRRQALGWQSQTAIATRYDWNSIGPRLEEAYEAAISRT